MKIQSFAVRAVFLFALCGTAQAQIPVTDVANLASQLQQAITTITQLEQQYQDFTQQIEQYEQQITEFESLSGNYGLGDLYNGPDAKSYAPGSWEEALAILRQGGSPANAEDVAQFSRQYGEQYALREGTDVYSQPSQSTAAYTQEQRAQTSVAALSISKAAYNKTGERLERIDDYLGQIEGANDLKQAVDLNNRLQVELTQALWEMNRLQAVQMQMDATNSTERTQAVQRIGNLMRYQTSP